MEATVHVQRGTWAELVASFEHQQAAAIVLASGKRFLVEGKSTTGSIARSFGSRAEAEAFARDWVTGR